MLGLHSKAKHSKKGARLKHPVFLIQSHVTFETAPNRYLPSKPMSSSTENLGLSIALLGFPRGMYHLPQ